MDLDSIDPFVLPSHLLEEKGMLPKATGIYFAIDAQNNIQYIGKATSRFGIWQRWHQSHPQYKLLTSMEGVKIAYLLMSDSCLIEDIEKALIQYFNPPLNKRWTLDYVSPRKGKKIRTSEKSFTVRLADEEYQLLQSFCAVKERSMNDVIREFVRNLPKLRD